MLVQDRDVDLEERGEMQVVTERRPTEAEWQELLFAWRVCKHVRSNAIVIARDLATIGIGAGQMSRVDSVRLAIEKARDGVQGAVLASDAYFPFADGPELALEAGVTAIIQPGGSVRDHEVVEAVDRAGGGDGVHQPPPLPPLTERFRRAIRRRPYEGQFGFSRVVRVGGFVMVGGTTSVDEEGAVCGDTPTSRRSRSCARSSMSSRGSASAPPTWSRPRLRDRHLPRRGGRPRPRRGLRRRIRPLMTMVEVSGLIDPRMLVEIEAVAYAGCLTAPDAVSGIALAPPTLRVGTRSWTSRRRSSVGRAADF